MKVLVGIADPKSAEQIVNSIAPQFAPQTTEIRVMHVIQPISISTPPHMGRSFTPELQDERKLAREFVDKVAAQMTKAGFKVESFLEEGDVRELIIDAAAHWHADLVIVGSRGTSNISRLLLGSVTEAVMRHAPCSVQVVRVVY